MFQLRCYNCHKGKGYSMDEIKILHYLQDNYLPKDCLYFAERGQQLKIRPKASSIPGFKPPLYYCCDGYSRMTFSYGLVSLGGKATVFIDPLTQKGTIFEILGDYHHSNPQFYKPDEISVKKASDGRMMTHKENFEYTMNRLKHIEEQGYKVFYIWVSDFRRFTRDLETKADVHLFDYMNVEKKYHAEADYTLLPKGSQKYLTEIPRGITLEI